MDNINPINLNNGVIHIHGYRKIDMQRLESFETDLFEILGNPENTKFIPERYIANKQDIGKLLLGVTMGYANKTRWSHFLSLVQFNNKVVGQIDILSPSSVKKSYNIENMWFIEYYLNMAIWNKGIMTSALGAVISNLKEQGITNIGALCQRDNISSISILKKLGFNRQNIIDNKQDYYKLV